MLREPARGPHHDARLYGLMTEHRARGSVLCSHLAAVSPTLADWQWEPWPRPQERPRYPLLPE
jgi:hypothetical protein